MRPTLLLSSILFSTPLILAQTTSLSLTRSVSMIPFPSATAPAVTMAWDDKPNTLSTPDAATTTGAAPSLMTMPNGSVMPLGAMASGTGRMNMTGVNFTGGVERLEVAGGMLGLAWAVSGFGAGVGAVLGLL